MNDASTIDTLNLLIRTSRDGEAGFLSCAEQLQSSRLRELMRARADECARAVEELAPLVRRFGGEPVDTTSAPGDAHRAWVVARAALVGADDGAVLDECERGEDVALADYRRALQADLPPDVAQVVRHQLQGVQRNHDQVKALRDALARGESPEGAVEAGRSAAVRDDGRRGRQTPSGNGSPAGSLMHWTLTQVRLHPLQTLGVAALLGVIGWSAMSRRSMGATGTGLMDSAARGARLARGTRLARLFR
jgi:uncharacterized protein (TIGR02284 family)